MDWGRVHRILEDCCKEEGPWQDPCQPLSADVLKDLQRVWPRVCSLVYEEYLFHAASLLAFFSVLRVSELVAASKQDVSNCWSSMSVYRADSC